MALLRQVESWQKPQNALGRGESAVVLPGSSSFPCPGSPGGSSLTQQRKKAEWAGEAWRGPLSRALGREQFYCQLGLDT